MDSGPASVELMRRALEIACAALDEPEAQRRLWAEQQCGNDATLRQEVAALLAADDQPEQVLRPDARIAELPDPWPGRLVGRFRIGERLGSGGMGTVYRAEPESGISRKSVALKLIKRGMDSEEVLRRFLRERDILARLDHPHIARLLDGGMTDDERPWFALELVEGEALLSYCDHRQLTVPDRIGLILQICDAVSYAHQNLIVHRDIKPGNVLVTSDAQAKLLDFGIAKLIDSDGESATRSALAVMTPDYAAPEQYERGPITTQTDVYLLGLLLAELLSGKRQPWPMRPDAKDYRLPPPLNAPYCGRHVSNDPELLALAAKRGTHVTALARQLRGDLDRITQKATAYDAEHRYGSVAEMAADLRRHQRGEPVLAMGDSWRYRLLKSLARHRTAVLATLAVLAALGVGAISTLRESARLRIAEAQTETSLKLLEDVFLGANPYEARGGDTRATDLLAGVRERLLAEPDLPPAMATRLWSKLASTYVSLDQRAPAESALQQVITQGKLAADCPARGCVDRDPTATRILVAGAQARLAHYQLTTDRDADALPALQQAIAGLRAAGAAAGPTLAKALQFLNDYEYTLGQFADLDARSSEIVALERAASGEVSREAVMALGYRASVLRATGRAQQALPIAIDAYRLAKVLGEQIPPAVHLYAEQQYAGTLTELGRSAEAEPILSAALERAIGLHGADSLIALGLAWDLANAHSELGEFARARDEFRAQLRSSETLKSASVAAIHNALGVALLGNDEAHAGAAELAIAAAMLCDAAMDSPPCMAITLNQIDADLSSGELAAAERRLDQLRETALGYGGRAAMRWHWLNSRLQLQLGNLADAEHELALSRSATTESVGQIDQARWLTLDAEMAEARNDRPKALELLHQVQAIYQTIWIGNPPALQQVRARLDNGSTPQADVGLE